MLTASIKKELKDSWRVDFTRCLLALTTFYSLLLGLNFIKSAMYRFQMQVMFVRERYKSLYIYINRIYVYKIHQCCLWLKSGLPDSPLLSTKSRLSPLYPCQLNTRQFEGSNLFCYCQYYCFKFLLKYTAMCLLIQHNELCLFAF